MSKLFRPKEYITAMTIEEAVFLLEKYGERAKPIAGCTDLFVERPSNVDYLIDITPLPLDYISKDPKTLGINIGALTSIRNIETSTLFQDVKFKVYNILSEVAHKMASTNIRNIATIGGNICNAVPSADFPPVLIALDAKVRVVGPKKKRIVSLEEFFLDVRKTVLQRGELLTEIRVPEQPPITGTAFFKVGRVHIDIALVNVATRVSLGVDETCNDVRIVFGAVAPTPIRAKKAEQLLQGKKIGDTLIEKVGLTASKEVKPISDVRASINYRREMCNVLVKRALKRAYNRAKEVKLA